MRVWTNTTATGYWPVGFAAVVVAETAQRAADALNQTLDKHKLHQANPISAIEMIELDTTKINVQILVTGDY